MKPALEFCLNLYAPIFIVALGLVTPVLQGQCQPLGETPQPAATEGNTTKVGPATPPFYDEPQFTVAGVTDPTNLGGHGADTIVRTKESLARDTASLGRTATPAAQPAESGTPYTRVRAYADAGQYERARESLREGFAGNKLAQMSPADQAALHHLRGEIEEKLNNPVQAAREFQRAAELEASESNVFDWGAELLLHRAPEPAAEVFARGRRLFPRSVRMLAGLGVAWYARGSYDQAAGSLCQASDLNPSDASPYLFLGKIMAAGAEQSEGVAQRLQRFARLQPDNSQANYFYALSLWKQRGVAGDSKTLERVESLLQKAVLLDPRFALGHLQLGIIYSERKDFPRAIAAYQEAAQADPGLPEPHYRLAQALKRTGETEKSQAELRLYEQTSKDAQEQIARQRKELQQFVVKSGAPGPTDPPR